MPPINMWVGLHKKILELKNRVNRFFKGKKLSRWKCECPKRIDEKYKKKKVEKTTLNVQSSPLDNH